MQLRSIAFFLLILSVLACSDDRLFPREGGSFVAGVPQSLLSKSEKVTISSRNDLPFITKNGTRIDFREDVFNRLKNGSAVTFPIDLEIIELLSLKDIILHNKPTVSSGKLLTTDGQIYIKASKNGEQLSLVGPWNFNIRMEGISGKFDPEMLIFLGADTQEGFNWRVDTTNCGIGEGGHPLNCENIWNGGDTTVANEVRNLYNMWPSSLGWINIDKFAEYTNTTTITISSEESLENVSVFLYFPEINSVMDYFDSPKLLLPVGYRAKVIAFAFNESDEVYSFFEDIVVKEDLQVNVSLSKSSKDKLEEALRNL
jgi:hypothetical protein